MICPACIASTATLAVGVTSSGGAIALVLSKVRCITGFRKRSLDSKTPDSQAKEKQS
jgi:hypothetical protein